MSKIFLILIISLAPDFPEARDFPEAPPAVEDSGSGDFFTPSATMLVQLSRKARVKYRSGRVVTLYACHATNVNKDGTVLVKMADSGRVTNIRLAGVQLQPIAPYTPEQTYGWKGGPPIDRTDRDREVTLAEMERHAILVDTYQHDYWVEFDGDPPTPPYKASYPGYLYGAHSTHNIGPELIETGYAHVAPGARSAAYLQTLQDHAAKERKGLWDEGRWRGTEKTGFDYLKRMPRDPRSGPGRTTPSRRAPQGRPR